MVQPSTVKLPVWQCPGDSSADKPYLVFRRVPFSSPCLAHPAPRLLMHGLWSTLPALPVLPARWNSLRAQSDGSPWPANGLLTFQACAGGGISYTQAVQPAVSVRISRNKAFFAQGPFTCTP